MEKLIMDLTWFGEEGAAAPAAGPDAGGSETAVTDAAAGGQVPQPANISPRVAAEMQRQMKAHPEKYAAGKPQAQPQQQVDAQAAQAQERAKAELQNRWEAAKKGEFAELYGQDVQNAIRERFKNQKLDQTELDGYRGLEPALKVLRERAGVETNAELAAQIMDDDSLYEDAANEAGMTVSAYKEYLQFKNEHDQHVREAEEQQNRAALEQHYMKLVDQANKLKEQFPNFDLKAELNNQEFLRLTSPEVGTSVEAAYYACHYKELAPQMLAYGMQRAKDQMAGTIRANGARPREGGLNTQNTAADMQMNFRAMDRSERNKIYAMIHSGKK